MEGGCLVPGVLAWGLGAHAAWISLLQIENKEENFICVKIDGKLQYNSKTNHIVQAYSTLVGLVTYILTFNIYFSEHQQIDLTLPYLSIIGTEYALLQ